MKSTASIAFIVIAVIIAAIALYYLNLPKSPVVEAPEPPIPEGTLDTGNDPGKAGEEVGGDDGTGIANPASVYCAEQGGRTEIREGVDGQQGICVMPDGVECDEWEFFRTKNCGAIITAPVDGGQTGNTPNPGAPLCGRENCHGLDIKCGPNPAEICTMEYRLGDKCLRLVNCGIEAGVCQQIPNAAFDACSSCVQKCETDFANDPQGAFACEAACPAENN